jgi:hypothetical protein
MTLCTGCKYYSLSLVRPMCSHEEAFRRTSYKHLVDGSPLAAKEQFSCESMRAGICGAEARLFEPKVEAV